LAGEPLIEFGPSGADAQVTSVAYQTDDAVDDVRIGFATGHRCYIQAKRNLAFDAQFRDAVAQWVEAAKAGLGPDEHVAIVAGSLNGPMRNLAEVLDMLRASEHGALTGEQQRELDRLDELLAELSANQRSELLRSAHIVHLDVEKPTCPHAAAARMALRSVVAEGETPSAWTQLLAAAGVASRSRQGHDLSGWLAQLAPHVSLRDDGGSALVRRNQVRGRYLDHLRSFGRTLDLRHLGAQLPRTGLSDLDADIKVVVDLEDSRATQLLVWAFLRRGRMVLTGLPGGGKSTALAQLVADLSDLGDTIPVFVRLRDLAGEPGAFGDRVLDQACRHVGPGDADDLRALIAGALAAGDVTLVLDGLDEAYHRRHEVIGELEQFLDTVSPDVDVILATRDVAYADAATLGWPDLRLAPPENLEHLVGGVLRLAATHQAVPAGELDEWVSTRQEWVVRSMQSEPSLRETPLLPTLLALLASEREGGALPTGRATVLWTMIEAVVARSERHRGPDHRVGALESRAASKALLESFEVEANLLLTHDRPVPRSDLVTAVADQLRPNWGLAQGQALVAAEEAVRFWDETGVFTLSGAEELATPRLALFSEIGAARQAACGDEASIDAWVAVTAESDGFECLALAAGLNPLAADALTTYAISCGDRRRQHRLLMTAVRAIRTGATLSPGVPDQLKNALLGDALSGDDKGWESLRSVVDFLEPDDLPSLSPAADAFPSEHRSVIHALFALRYPDVVVGDQRRATLLAAIETNRLPRLDDRFPDDKPSSFERLTVDRALMDALTGAAHELAGSDPEPILRRIRDGSISTGAASELSELMTRRGHALAVAEIHREKTAGMRAVFDLYIGAGRYPYLDLLDGLGAAEPATLTRQQRRRLDELADLIETMCLNNASSTLKEGVHRGHSLEVAELVMTLADLRTGVIAAQARIVRDRMALFDDNLAAYFSLFDRAQVLPLTHWERVDDIDSALELARDLLFGGLGSAEVAAQIHTHAPSSEAAITALRDVVQHLEDQSPDHLMMAAYCLERQQDGFEPHWQSSPNPMLRRVVARLAPPVIDGHLNPTVKELLEDPDGTVRVEAVRNVAGSHVAERDQLLEAVAAAGNPAFTCMRCRHVTPADTQFCVCRIGGAQPATEAAEALRNGCGVEGVAPGLDD
jgi:hypothetical protein